MTAGPLKGVFVLDLTRFLPGPYCTMLLADMGAEVIKIEEPQPHFSMKTLNPDARSPEEARRLEIILNTRSVNRNKKSITLNLKSKEGQQIFHKLAKNADVVVEEFRPGVTSRLGIDYKTLKRINNRIIYCAITGYGQDGPYKNLPGHDPNYESIAGILGITGTNDGIHVIPGIPIGDLCGGVHGAIGILCALIAREKTGKGQFVDISITDGLISWLGVSRADTFFATGRQQMNIGDRPSHVYKTKDDKYICVMPAEPHFWERLCGALGLEEYIPYHREILLFAPSLPEKRAEIISAFTRVFRTKTRDQWFQILWQADTCVAPVYDFNEVFEDPQVLHRQMVVEVEYPELGNIKQTGIAIKLSDTPGKIKMRPPRLGEHTKEILDKLGYTKQNIVVLRSKGVIR